jgi:hypothetical protein
MHKDSNKSSLLNGSSTTALSKEIIVLLEEFSSCFQWDKAGKLLQKINEQGKKDGLSKEQIRGLIFSYFKGELGDRQLRRLLPLELKYTEFANKKKNAASEADIMSTSDERAGTQTLADKPDVEIEEDRHITSGAATKKQEQTMEENVSGISQTKSAYAATAAAPALTNEQNAQDIGVLPREDSELIVSLKTENKKQKERIDYLVGKLGEKSPEFAELYESIRELEERIRELEENERKRVRHSDFNSPASSSSTESIEEFNTLRKELAEQAKLLSKDTFEGELEMRGLPIPLIVQINWSTGRATITRK